jgi:hypothetical protein
LPTGRVRRATPQKGPNPPTHWSGGERSQSGCSHGICDNGSVSRRLGRGRFWNDHFSPVTRSPDSSHRRCSRVECYATLRRLVCPAALSELWPRRYGDHPRRGRRARRRARGTGRISCQNEYKATGESRARSYTGQHMRRLMIRVNLYSLAPAVDSSFGRRATAAADRRCWRSWRASPPAVAM